jgi:integrase
LTWEDIDFDKQEVRVRFQLSRAARDERPTRIPLKTKRSRREVSTIPQLEAILREHQKGSDDDAVVMLRRPIDLIFRTNTGGSMGYHDLNQRGVRKAADLAGLNPDGVPKLSCHNLRKTFISFLIRQGLDPFSVSRQAGHSKAFTTMDIYAGEFEKVKNQAKTRDAAARAFGGE